MLLRPFCPGWWEPWRTTRCPDPEAEPQYEYLGPQSHVSLLPSALPHRTWPLLLPWTLAVATVEQYLDPSSLCHGRVTASGRDGVAVGLTPFPFSQG